LILWIDLECAINRLSWFAGKILTVRQRQRLGIVGPASASFAFNVVAASYAEAASENRSCIM